MSKVNARILNKILTTDVDFTIPPNEDLETFEGWSETDLAVGEIGLNSFRGIAYVNFGEEILPLIESAPIPIGATLMKTGMVTSNQTGDDAFNPQGRDNDFFILGGLTPWGNNRRFSDELGNTSDATAYYDISGAVIPAYSAYLEQVFIDWSTFDGSTYLMYYFGEFGLTKRNFSDWITWTIGLSILGYTDWLPLNENELLNLKNPSRQGVTLYPPLSKKGVFGGEIWSNTSHTATPTAAYSLSNYGGTVSQHSKTSTAYCLAVRRGTLAEIGL